MMKLSNRRGCKGYLSPQKSGDFEDIFFGGVLKIRERYQYQFTKMRCDNGKLLCEGPMILNFDDSCSNEHK